MAYEISYGPVKTKQPKTRKNTPRSLILFLCTAALIIGLSITGSGDRILQWLIPGDSNVTSAAFSTMIENLRDGLPLYESVTAFCKEIIENAKISQ